MRSRNSRQRVKKIERQRKAWDLRLQGYTQCEIAAELGCDPSTVGDDLKRQGEIVRVLFAQEALTFAEQELERYDKLLKGCRNIVFDDQGNIKDQKAAALCLKILAQRAQLLGINKPTKVELSTYIPLEPETIRTQLQEVLAERQLIPSEN